MSRQKGRQVSQLATRYEGSRTGRPRNRRLNKQEGWQMRKGLYQLDLQ